MKLRFRVQGSAFRGSGVAAHQLPEWARNEPLYDGVLGPCLMLGHAMAWSSIE